MKPYAVKRLVGCAATAQRYDYERYLACLFAPADRAESLFALLAANHEIARTAEAVSELTIGLIRLQWWRETLDGVAMGMPRAHEVAVALARAADRRPEILVRLGRIVDAREADLDGEPPEDLEALEAYALATAGELHASIAEILGADPEPAAETGAAWGLLGLMRALPMLIITGRLPIPRSLLENNRISINKIKDKPTSVALAECVRPVVERARSRLVKARRSSGFDAPSFRPLRLLTDRAEDHAGRLQAAGFAPFDPRVARETPALAWRYAARWLRYRVGL